MQKFLEDTYPLILSVCRGITFNYEDLAHDLIIKLKPEAKEVPLCKLKSYLWKTARNLHIDKIRRERYTELIYDPTAIENEPIPDAYSYIQRIRQSDLSDLEKLWIETYLDYEGSYTDKERKLK